MKALSAHYRGMRRQYPDDNLLIIFDIDNTILDMRHMIVRVLAAYDARRGTRWFDGLEPSDLSINENQVGELLQSLDIPEEEQARIEVWYVEKRWSPQAILYAHRPFSGVMEAIRWFQMQPRTFVGLNTGRPEVIREQTLRSLNLVGQEYKVVFEDRFLHMNPGGWDDDARGSKVDGVRKYQELGYRVFAIVDNEPGNLEIMEGANDDGEILMLHADTIFDSKRSRLPQQSVSGADYRLEDLVPPGELPSHVQFVWHGVNDEPNLVQFLASNVQWAECDVRWDGTRVILRHDSFDEHPMEGDEELFELGEVLAMVRDAGKSIKLDLKEQDPLVDEVIQVVRASGLKDDKLWFNASIEDVDEAGFRRLHEAFPGAELQCPVGFMSRLILKSPQQARRILEVFRSWGINRLSVAWGTKKLRRTIDQLDAWGFRVNIFNIPDLESFLKAVLMLPQSVTSDFNFPQWRYYGRGSGRGRRFRSYTGD